MSHAIPSSAYPSSAGDSAAFHLVHPGTPMSLDDLLDLHTPHTYIVRAHGDGMTGAGIHDNDLLVVDRSLLAESGEVVVAAVNGEPLIRRLDIIDGTFALVAANERYPAIRIVEGDELSIWGVVRWNLHCLVN